MSRTRNARWLYEASGEAPAHTAAERVARGVGLPEVESRLPTWFLSVKGWGVRRCVSVSAYGLLVFLTQTVDSSNDD